MALDKRSKRLLDRLNRDLTRHTQSNTLVKPALPAVLLRRLEVQCLDWRQRKRRVALLLVVLRLRAGREALGELGEVQDRVGPQHVLNGHLDVGEAGARDDAHGPDAVTACCSLVDVK